MFARYRFAYQVLLGLALFQIGLAILIGTADASKFLPNQGFVHKMLPAWVLIPLSWAGLVSIKLVMRRVDRPLEAVRRIVYVRRHWLARGALFMLVVLYFSISFTSIKTAIPNYMPFYADPALVEIDKALFGTDPWRITHGLIGEMGTVVIDRIYMLWFMVMMLFIGWFCFSSNQVLQLRGLLSFILAWLVLGSGLAIAGSSVGPCFYERFYGDPYFSPLMLRLEAVDASHRLFATGSMNYLISSIGQDRFGAGISAMPSLHVAIAYLCLVVTLAYTRSVWPKLLMALFFAVIAIGSVHLGWHYAVDGIVSVIVTALIWWGTGRFVDWVERREARLGGGDGPVAAGPALA